MQTSELAYACSLQVAAESDQDEDELFKPRGRRAAEDTAVSADAMDALDSCRVTLDAGRLQQWQDAGSAERLRNRFVTGQCFAAGLPLCIKILMQEWCCWITGYLGSKLPWLLWLRGGHSPRPRECRGWPSCAWASQLRRCWLLLYRGCGRAGTTPTRRPCALALVLLYARCTGLASRTCPLSTQLTQMQAGPAAVQHPAAQPVSSLPGLLSPEPCRGELQGSAAVAAANFSIPSICKPCNQPLLLVLQVTSMMQAA